jgi:hypothetical protein
LGDYKGHSVKHWSYNTELSGGKNHETTVLTIDVEYTNGNATETFTFSGHEEPLRIAKHEVSSKLLELSAK